MPTSERHAKSRVERLDLLCHKYVETIVRSINHDHKPNYMKSLMDTYKDTSTAEKQMEEYVETCLETTFDQVNKRHDLHDKIQRLETLIHTARLQGQQAMGARVIPRPEHIIRASSIHLKQQELQRLEAAKQEISHNNRVTMQRVHEKRQRALHLHSALVTSIEDFQQ
ncbi:hypothetical protein BDF14DRAFT_493131 [Spinellus fusiger]|nr:hypothetical protein BDF14DRAFT_493131 [Spinellus fusiger]